MKRKIVLLVLAGSFIMQGAGIQSELLPTAGASENLPVSESAEAVSADTSSSDASSSDASSADTPSADTPSADTSLTDMPSADVSSEDMPMTDAAVAADASSDSDALQDASGNTAGMLQPSDVDNAADGREHATDEVQESKDSEKADRDITGADQVESGSFPAETASEQNTDNIVSGEKGEEKAETGNAAEQNGSDPVSDHFPEHYAVTETTDQENILPPIEELLVPKDDQSWTLPVDDEVLKEEKEKVESVDGSGKYDTSAEKAAEKDGKAENTEKTVPGTVPGTTPVSSILQPAQESASGTYLEETIREPLSPENDAIRSPGTEAQNIAVQRSRKTEELQNLLDAAEVDIGTRKESSGKENLTMTLAGARPAKVSIKLVRLDGGTVSGKADDTGGQVLISREIIPGMVKAPQPGISGQTISGSEAHTWEMEILSAAETENILQAIPDSDGLYRISVTYEDEEGNSASRDIPFKVNRFGSIYVYDQICSDLQDAYVRKVEKDLVISEYNPDRLLAESLKVEVTRDGEPLDRVLFTVQEVPDAEKKNDGMYGWYRYDYIISRKNFTKDGIYQVSVSSADEAGNEPDSMDYYKRPIIFRVDSTDPEVDFIQETNRHLMTKTEAVIRYQAFDAIRLKKIRVLLDEKLYEEISEIPEATKYQGSVSLSGLGKHKLQIEITDMAGNQYTSERMLIHGIPAWIYAAAGAFAMVITGTSAWFAHRRKRKKSS
ncbi:MAG: hypothetical protein ACI4ET_12180 [Bilifractor sp.]